MNRYQCNNHRSGRCDKVMEGNLSSTAPDGVAPFGHFRFYQELLRVQCWDYCCSYLLALHIVSVKYTSSFMHHVKTICQTKFQLPVSQMGGFLRDDITANIDGSKIKSEFIECRCLEDVLYAEQMPTVLRSQLGVPAVSCPLPCYTSDSLAGQGQEPGLQHRPGAGLSPELMQVRHGQHTLEQFIN